MKKANTIKCALIISVSMIVVALSPTMSSFLETIKIVKAEQSDQTTVYLPLVAKDYQKFLLSFSQGEVGKGSDLYVMREDGLNLVRLTNVQSSKMFSQVWSPDATMIAFNPYGPFSVVNADGSELKTFNGVYAYKFGWTKDGKSLVFTSFMSDPRTGVPVEILCQINADGTGYKITGIFPDYYAWFGWSPYGDKFLTGTGGNYYLINSDGTHLTQITNSSKDFVSDCNPTWSRDQLKIFFCSARDGNSEIYSMDRTGANQKRLTNDPSKDYSPSVSPDGTKISFFSDRPGYPAIFIMNGDGSSPIQVTSKDFQGMQQPTWSKDSRRLAFVSSIKPLYTYAIYAVDKDGNNLMVIWDKFVGELKYQP